MSQINDTDRLNLLIGFFIDSDGPEAEALAEASDKLQLQGPMPAPEQARKELVACIDLAITNLKESK